MGTEARPALGSPVARARVRACPEDFRVYEEGLPEPDGSGEHLWLHLRKRGHNTDDLARHIAREAGVRRSAVSWSGRKDRHAVTEQWFSVQLPGREDPDFRWPEGVELLQAVRHGRKLRPGTHRRNRFVLRLRELQGDRDELEGRLRRVAADGVPNYFGVQRFGTGGGNFARARAWLLGQGPAPRGRSRRSLWLSAARSELFNRVLVRRVEEGVWNAVLDGDILQPRDSRGLFREEEDPRVGERVAAGEVHPTAPLPGTGGMASSGACARLEARVLAPEQALIEALGQQGVEAARRATRLFPRDFRREWVEDGLELEFRLPAGAFATTVLAELVLCEGEREEEQGEKQQ